MSPFLLIYRNRGLIAALTKRELIAKYRGSILGSLWVVLGPALMLGIYYFVFGYIFNSRWSDGLIGKAPFAAALFCGINLFNMFGEAITKSPTLVLANANYVKKIQFPLEILSVVSVVSSLINLAIGFVLLIVFMIVTGQSMHMSVFVLPMLLIPYVLLMLGLSWIVSSLGVYFRDISQFSNYLATALLFLSPVFYPITAIPGYLRKFFYLNPLTYIVESVRNVVIFNVYPGVVDYSVYAVTALLFFFVGYFWFRRLKVGFADVL